MTRLCRRAIAVSQTCSCREKSGGRGVLSGLGALSIRWYWLSKPSVTIWVFASGQFEPPQNARTTPTHRCG